jgi:hypothetical protein
LNKVHSPASPKGFPSFRFSYHGWMSCDGPLDPFFLV